MGSEGSILQNLVNVKNIEMHMYNIFGLVCFVFAEVMKTKTVCIICLEPAKTDFSTKYRNEL